MKYIFLHVVLYCTLYLINHDTANVNHLSLACLSNYFIHESCNILLINNNRTTQHLQDYVSSVHILVRVSEVEVTNDT